MAFFSALQKAGSVVGKLAVILLPLLISSVWLFAGYSTWKLFGMRGLAAWTVPTTTAVLYFSWSTYETFRQAVGMSNLSREEQLERYSNGGVFVTGFPMILGLLMMQTQGIAGKSGLLRTVSWLSLSLASLVVGATALASWVACGLLLSGLGIVGILAGMMTPMLLFFHWMGELSKLKKAHPECIGGT